MPASTRQASSSRRVREAAHAADRRQEAAARILAVDAGLDGVAARLNRRLLERQRFARGNAQLPFDEVESRNHLGDGMLDLQPRVHFHEIKSAVRADDEFDGARIHVADGLGGAHRGIRHRGPRRRVDEGRRRFFDDLLVAALHRAFALEEVDAMAVRVAEHLDFHVPGPLEKALEHQAAVAERALGLAAGAADRLVEGAGLAHDAHALAAAARDGLDEERESRRAPPRRRARSGDWSSPM